MENDVKQGHVWFREHPWNVGQHVAHNEMLDECVRRDFTWHIRVDDDCWLSGTKWLSRLIAIQKRVHNEFGCWIVISPKVSGLREPPPGRPFLETRYGPGRLGRDRLEKVEILGGIFRMSKLSTIKYFRWDERMPMGFGDARQFSSYCNLFGMPMVRVVTLSLTHGDSTDMQEKKDPAWAHEHDMLQYMPLGL